MKFKTVEQDVREILEYNNAARSDDMILYCDYVYDKVKNLRYGDKWLQMVFSNRRFRIIHGIAPYETVSRVRRKLQEVNEDLRPSKEDIERRKRIERQYREYARGAD